MNRPLLSCALVMALTSASASLVQAQPAVVMRGASTCPSADMILAALRAARPEGWPPAPIVTVEIVDDRILLTLGDAASVPRSIPADRDCWVRAESIALVVAAWSGELASSPTDSPLVTGLSEPPSSAPASGTPASPGPSEPAAPVAAERSVAVVRSPVPKPGPVQPRRQVMELDGGVFYSPLWGHAPGAWLGAGRTPREGGFGARLFGAYQSARDIALEGGNNQVLRFLVGAAVTYHLQSTYLFAAGDLGLFGSYTRASGSGYETNGTAATENLGGLVGLRGGLRLGRARLWLDGRLLRMAHEETVKVQSTSPGVADHAVLSAWDVQLGAGIGFRFE